MPVSAEHVDVYVTSPVVHVDVYDTSSGCPLGRLRYKFRSSLWTFTIRVPAVRVDIYGTGSGFSVVGILGTGGRKGEISGHPGARSITWAGSVN